MANALLSPKLGAALKKFKPTITRSVDKNKIDPLLVQLEAVLVDNEIDGIKAQTTPHGRLSEMVTCVIKGTNDHLRHFVQALEDSSVGCELVADAIRKSVLAEEPTFTFFDESKIGQEEQHASTAALSAVGIRKGVRLSDEAKSAFLAIKMDVSERIDKVKHLIILDSLKDKYKSIVQQEYDDLNSPEKKGYVWAATLIDYLVKGTVEDLGNFLKVLELRAVGCSVLAQEVRAGIIQADPTLSGSI